MTTHLSGPVAVIQASIDALRERVRTGNVSDICPELRALARAARQKATQDGWDWPNGCTDERWPVPEEWRGPATEYWRAMKALGEDV